MLRIFLLVLGSINLFLLFWMAAHWSGLNRLARVTMAGLVFAFFPVCWGSAVVYSGLNQMKAVEFCGSCHVMEPYLASLSIADDDSIPSFHYRNNWVKQDNACYSCHTSYGMFGDVRAKLNGLKHVWVNYVTGPPEKIELYSPYLNQDCLHCHASSQRFKEGETHQDEMAAILSGNSSCLEGGCHDVGHVFTAEDW